MAQHKLHFDSRFLHSPAALTEAARRESLTRSLPEA
jgi:hypothetical protein